MTKRIYYTCPIKALYMMKEFGVKFTNDGQIIEEIENIWMGLSIIGDYGIKEDEECFITMRDNKQFFMPEVEDE
jgi:hypothetical protein